MKEAKKKYYSVILWGQNQTILKAASIDVARRDVLREWGASSEPRVAPATKADVAWVRAMGGAIHEV